MVIALLLVVVGCDNNQAEESSEQTDAGVDNEIPKDQDKEDTQTGEGTHDLDTLQWSPDGDVLVTFISDDELTYHVDYKGERIIDTSALGFEFREMKSMKEGFQIVSVDRNYVNETWEPVWGQKSEILNEYNSMVIQLKEIKEPQRLMDIEFRVFDDGVGFRYVIPEQDGVGEFEIMDELTEFVFTEDHTCWWIRNDWDSYEYLYQETPLSQVRDVSTPFTMRSSEGLHISIHEAALWDYAGMALRRMGKNTFESHLAPWPDKSKVKASAGMKTPWRTIQIGDDAGDLAESSMILNLNEPLAIEDTSWIQPMKYMGIWWEMHINKSDWGRHNNNHGATTENAKYYIDFIGEHLTNEPDSETIGLLIEGWNQGWDGNWMDNFDKFIFTEDGEYEDFDVSEVVAYGEKANVEYIMHNETSGGILNYENQMAAAYSDYQRLGINAIKSGYVSDNGMQEPKGMRHHGQYMVNHYNNAVILASEHELMINTHEPIKPTGLSRTYPNWVAREGVQGMEYNAWSDGNPPEHTTIIPFTRILGGPIDYTPGIFDVEIGGRSNRVHTTRAKQLALYVVLYSPLQMITDLPENYLDEDGEPFEEFDFVKNVPVDWDDTVVIDAEIGDYTAIARKGKGTDNWYVGAITDEEARELTLELSFLDAGRDYVAVVYADDEGVDWLKNPDQVMVYSLKVNANDLFHLALPEGGGAAMEIIPADSIDGLASINDYNYEKLSVLEVTMDENIQANDIFEAVVNVENPSSVIVGEHLGFYINGEKIYDTYMRIEPSSTKEVVFPYHLFFEPGDYEVTIGDYFTQTVTVEVKEPTLSIVSQDVYTNGDTIFARIKVVNLGSRPGEMELEFFVDGQSVEIQTIEVGARAGGQTKGVNFKYEATDGVTYEVKVNDMEVVKVTP